MTLTTARLSHLRFTWKLDYDPPPGQEPAGIRATGGITSGKDNH